MRYNEETGQMIGSYVATTKYTSTCICNQCAYNVENDSIWVRETFQTPDAALGYLKRYPSSSIWETDEPIGWSQVETMADFITEYKAVQLTGEKQ
jgi:hypothetical protein